MHFNKHIADLPYIFKENMVRHIVLCPGSRNAPLMQIFTRDKAFTCHSIVDERSAGYVALGMSKLLLEPVAVITTSGTAALNLGPAVAEAYFQKIPLIVLTADRPLEWPSQFSNQVVRQDGIYAGNSKSYYSLPEDFEDDASLREGISRMREVINSANIGEKGPVHLNIKLKEPLYELILESVSLGPGLSHQGEDAGIALTDAEIEKLSSALETQKRILVFLGAGSYSNEEVEVMQHLSEKFNVVFVAENIANLHSANHISHPELVLGSQRNNWEVLKPDLVISIGGQVVSKLSRLFIQGFSLLPILDIKSLPTQLLNELVLNQDVPGKQAYYAEWKRMELAAKQKAEKYLKEVPFSNLSAVDTILRRIPGNAVVHLGNSGTIRYAQLCNTRQDLSYHANRGTSGIDGSLSTAVGAAMISDLLHVAILGDLSFVYDSNALWNKDFPGNLKIIVLNDKGGGIFRIIEGPESMPFFEEFSVTSHPVQLKELALGYGREYAYASDYKTLNISLDAIFTGSSGPVVLEVDTSTSENSSIFKGLYKSIQEH